VHVTWAKFEKTDINDPVFFSEQMEINGKRTCSAFDPWKEDLHLNQNYTYRKIEGREVLLKGKAQHSWPFTN
jgi:hypothetical protein